MFKEQLVLGQPDEWGQASLAQEGMWFTQRLGVATSAYHMPLAIWLDGALDVPAVVKSCEALVARHRVLGAALRERDGALFLAPAPVPPQVLHIDLTAAPTGDVTGQIRELKAQPGQDIVQYGFGAVSTLLMEQRLLDEVRLWFHPLFVGMGTTDDLLFPKAPPTQFELTDSTILKSGMAILTYRLA